MDIQSNLQPMVEIVKNIIPLREAYLFGSYAYGNPTPDSDYDLYFIVDKIEGSRHETIVAVRRAIRDVTNKPYDVLLNTKEHFDYRKGNKATLEHKVVKEGIKLYG